MPINTDQTMLLIPVQINVDQCQSIHLNTSQILREIDRHWNREVSVETPSLSTFCRVMASCGYQSWQISNRPLHYLGVTSKVPVNSLSLEE